MSAALPPSARAALESAWLEVLASRHPQYRWMLRPREGREGDATPAAGKVVGTVAAPEDEGAFADGNGTAGAADGPNEDGVGGGRE